MRTFTIILITFLGSYSVSAQKKADMKYPDALCGCYSVNFKYAETFSPDDAYKFHDREEMNATELALPIEKSDGKLVIQHLLVMNDTIIIKHWREEWVYEPTSYYRYMGNRVWQKKELAAADVKGKWLQTVWEVSDEPRYQGISAWITNDGKTYWESTADAPLPRREYTIRNDYNLLRRRNRITITADGYMHEQDNDKIIRTDKGDKLLAQEKGYNTYYKMDDAECAAAKKWWTANESFWKSVRAEWTKTLAAKPTVSIKEKVGEKMLNEHLTSMWKEWRAGKPAYDNQIAAKLKEFVNETN
jgi:hypothetical protein